MSYRHLSKLLLLVMAVGAVHFSCRPASYEIIKPKKGKSVEKNGTPNTVTPPDTQTEPPTTPPIDGNVPPTARVEVIWDGKSVTKVRINRPTTIRPTWDTLDPDDIGRSSCANPGIVKAEYDVGGEAKPTAARAAGCEPLDVPYIFTKVGEYKIDMLVTSNENETAFASMILHVIDETTPITDDGGFTIVADPMLVGIGQDVTFTGYCTTKKKHFIDWAYGDAATGRGRVTKHPYAKTGQYRVDATCTEDVADGKSWKAAVTIVVIDKPVVIPNKPTNPLPPPGDDGQTDGSDTPGDDGRDDGGEGRDDSPGDDGSDNPGDDGQDDGGNDNPGDDGQTDGTDTPGDDGKDDPGQGPGQKPGQNPPPGKPGQQKPCTFWYGRWYC